MVILADTAYRADWRTDLEREYGIAIRIVEKPADQKGFVVLPRRWVVERTFAWLTQARRLNKEYERLTASSEAMIYLAMTRLLLRRLAAT